MSTILHLLRGQMSSPVNHLGADVLIYHFSQGGRCPRGEMSGSPYGPVRLQRFSQRMPTYEKLMQNVGIRSKEKHQRKPFPERIQSVCITY